MHRKNQCIRKRLNKKSSNISLLSFTSHSIRILLPSYSNNIIIYRHENINARVFCIFFDTPERSKQHNTTNIKIKSEFQIKRIRFSSECNFLFTSQLYEKECCLLISSTFLCSSLKFLQTGPVIHSIDENLKLKKLKDYIKSMRP